MDYNYVYIAHGRLRRQDGLCSATVVARVYGHQSCCIQYTCIYVADTILGTKSVHLQTWDKPNAVGSTILETDHVLFRRLDLDVIDIKAVQEGNQSFYRG